MTERKHRLSPAAAVCSAIILLILRTAQLIYGVEYPSGLYLPESQVFNVVFNILLAAAGAVLAAAAYHDCKPLRGAPVISRKAAVPTGICLIIYGAAMMSFALSQLAGGADIYGIACFAGAAAAMIAGMAAIICGEIKPWVCVPVAVLILTFIIKTIVFYVNNPIITGMPQKFMVMLIYVLSLLFWINTGRMYSGGEKKLTRAASAASGFALGCAGVSYIGSSFLTMAIDGEKWLMLDNTPDIELIVISLVPAVLAALTLFSAKPAGVPEGENSPVKKNTSAPPARKPAPEDAKDTEKVPDGKAADIFTKDTENAPDEKAADIFTKDTENAPDEKAADIFTKDTENAPDGKADNPSEYDIDAILEEYSKK